MRVIFEKYSSNRAKRYQIKTAIVEKQGEKWAYKQALYPEGEQHIHTIAENYKRIQGVSDYSYVAPKMMEGKLFFEYAEGDTLSQRYLSAVIKGDDNTANECLELFSKCAAQSEKNSCVFHTTPDFEAIYGTSFSMLNGSKGVRIADVDVNMDNIILSEGSVKLIDYEWVFHFPMPLEYILFRNFREFYMKNEAILQNKIKLHDILHLLGITQEYSVLDEMEEHFRSFVSEGREIYPKNRYRQAVYYADRSKDGNVLGFLQKEIDRLNYVARDYETLKMVHEEQEKNLSSTRQELETLKQNLVCTQQKLAEYQTELESILSSRSWKLIKKITNIRKR